ncbi:MAG: hypothetical protein JNM85_04405 [Chthonomonas sp.]|nr:hypothetical protein [Chthonomonas sp.]
MSTKFFVVMPDGQKYGPAEVDMLTQWAAEGRLTHQSILESADTGQRLPAGSVQGILFLDAPSGPAAPPQQPRPFSSPGVPSHPQSNPYENPIPPAGFSQPPSPYARPHDVSGSGALDPQTQNNLIISWVMFGLAFAGCGCITPWIGMHFAKKVEAVNPAVAKAPYICNLILGILSAIGVLLYVFVMLAVFGSASR